MSLEIRVFDKKGEYQRFISGYGLHESHWEIILWNQQDRGARKNVF